MPLSKIEVCYSHPPTTVQALMDAVIQAQREVLQIPEHDRQIRYIEHRPEHFWIPPNKSQKYTLIEICMFYGRSLETKKKLYQTLVKNLTELGIPKDDIFILLQEQALENWGIRGGIPASEVDLGFKVEI
ncbi:MAG: tautomerase family protein [Acinetobacter sp.]